MQEEVEEKRNEICFLQVSLKFSPPPPLLFMSLLCLTRDLFSFFTLVCVGGV